MKRASIVVSVFVIAGTLHAEGMVEEWSIVFTDDDDVHGHPSDTCFQSCDIGKKTIACPAEIFRFTIISLEKKHKCISKQQMTARLYIHSWSTIA